MELREIIKDFKKIRIEENLQITDTTLFEQALDLYMSLGIQQGYNIKPTEKINPEPPKPQNQASTKPKDKKTEYGKPTSKMRFKLEKTWEHEDGREFLEEIGFDGDFDKLTYDKAKMFIQLIHEKEDKEKDY